MGKRAAAKILALSYAVYLAGWLVVCTFNLIYDRVVAPVSIPITAAGAVSLLPQENGGWVSENGDPQLVFEDVSTAGRRVVLYATFEEEPGEMALYYTRKAGQGFTPARRAFGRPVVGGGWEYILPPGTLHSLRIDPGSIGGVAMRLGGLEVNPRVPVLSYYVPKGADIAGFALLPALAVCAIYTIIEAGLLLHKKLRGARRKEKA